MRRFVLLDALRFLLAFMVVAIHCPTPFKTYYDWVLCSAVPLFFMISGFLMYGKNTDSVLKGIKKISKVTIVASIIYLPVYLFVGKALEYDVLYNWVRMLLFNEHIESIHLWYLLAYLYVLVFFYIFHKTVALGHKLLWFLGFVLLLGHLYIRQLDVEEYYWRNWILMGLPFFIGGLFFRSLFQKYGWNVLRYSNPFLNKIADWGSLYSLDIYILHPLVAVICGYTLYRFFWFRALMWWMSPVVIFLITWGVCFIKNVIRHLYIEKVERFFR